MRSREEAILPVLLDDVAMPKELQHIKYADFRKSFEEGFQELMRVLEIDEEKMKLLISFLNPYLSFKATILWLVALRY